MCQDVNVRETTPKVGGTFSRQKNCSLRHCLHVNTTLLTYRMRAHLGAAFTRKIEHRIRMK